jgi:ribosomal protein L11 methyltransferase
MLERLLKNSVKNPPKNMLDVGCGSGILAMSFAKASGGKATGVEIDTLSASIAKENVINNKLEKFVRIVKGDAYKSKTVVKSAPYDLIMANIFAEPLRKMAKDLKRNLKPDGTAILSGLLNSQANDVIAAHAKVGLEPIKHIKIGEWSVLALKRV